MINKALKPAAQTFLLAVECTDVAIFRTGSSDTYPGAASAPAGSILHLKL